MNSGDEGFDAASIMRRLFAGERVLTTDQLSDWIRAIRAEALGSFTGLLRRLLAPVGLCIVLRALYDGASGGLKLQEMLCCVCCAATLLDDFELARQSAAALMTSAGSAVRAIAPVVSAAGALSLGSASTALFPIAAECVDVIEGVLVETGLPLCALAAGISTVGCVSRRYTFDRLFALCRSLAHWLLGGAVLAYTAILGMQGLASASRDGAALKIAQSALERMIPIIGKDISGTTGTLTSSLNRLVGAVGVTGVLALARLCARPLCGLFASMIGIRLAGAVLEPVAGPTMARMLDRFASTHETLLALCLCSVLLAAMQVVGATVLAGSLLG